MIKTCLSKFISYEGKTTLVKATGQLFEFPRGRLTLVEGLKQASSFFPSLISPSLVQRPLNPPSHVKFTWQSRIYAAQQDRSPRNTYRIFVHFTHTYINTCIHVHARVFFFFYLNVCNARGVLVLARANWNAKTFIYATRSTQLFTRVMALLRARVKTAKPFARNPSRKIKPLNFPIAW